MNVKQVLPRFKIDLCRRVARNLHCGEGGLFWRLDTASNDLDPDFHWSSLRLRRFFCPNLSDLQKKRSSSRLKPSFSGKHYIRFLTYSHRQYRWGEIFSFLVQKLASKVLKTAHFSNFSGQWGARAPPGYATGSLQSAKLVCSFSVDQKNLVKPVLQKVRFLHSSVFKILQFQGRYFLFQSYH